MCTCHWLTIIPISPISSYFHLYLHLLLLFLLFLLHFILSFHIVIFFSLSSLLLLPPLSFLPHPFPSSSSPSHISSVWSSSQESDWRTTSIPRNIARLEEPSSQIQMASQKRTRGHRYRGRGRGRETVRGRSKDRRWWRNEGTDSTVARILDQDSETWHTEPPLIIINMKKRKNRMDTKMHGRKEESKDYKKKRKECFLFFSIHNHANDSAISFNMECSRIISRRISLPLYFYFYIHIYL